MKDESSEPHQQSEHLVTSKFDMAIKLLIRRQQDNVALPVHCSVQATTGAGELNCFELPV